MVRSTAPRIGVEPARINNINKKRKVNREGTFFVPKYDTSIAPAWFLQAGVDFYRKCECGRRAVPPGGQGGGELLPQATGHDLSCWREESSMR